MEIVYILIFIFLVITAPLWWFILTLLLELLFQGLFDLTAGKAGEAIAGKIVKTDEKSSTSKHIGQILLGVLIGGLLLLVGIIVLIVVLVNIFV